MKIVVSLLLLLFLVVVVLGFIAPKDFTLEREIVVDRSLKEVFEKIKFLKNHEQWSAYVLKDPLAPKTYRGTDGTVGFTTSWVSENKELGTGEQEIKKLTPDERLDTEIRLQKPFEMAFDSYTKVVAVNETQTKVILGMYDEVPFPMNAISLIVNVCFGYKEKLIQNMDDTLMNMKEVLERK